MKDEYEKMHNIWRKIIAFGPKPMGSASLEECSVLLLEEMEKITDKAAVISFETEGWKPEGWSLFVGEDKLISYLFLGSGSSEKFLGNLEWLGKNRLWNMYSWDRYAVIDNKGETAAYITVRENGEAIPQMLFTGERNIPHFLVGNEMKDKLREAEKEKKSVSGYAKTERFPARCRNITGCLGQGKKEKKVVICSHYDTVYNTAGAYDNASGVAVVLELGRRLKERGVSCPVEIVLTDGEEMDLTGSRYIAEQCSSENTSAVLCIDGVGREKILEIWSGPEPFERKLRKILKESKEEFVPVYQCPPPPGSDQEPFYAKGIPVCMLTFNDQGILHSPRDVYEENKLDNMKVMVRIAMEILEKLGIVDS